MARMKKSQSGVRIPKQLIQKGKPDAKNSGLINDTISTNKKRSTPIHEGIHEGFKSFNDPTAKRSTRKYKTGGSLGMKSVKAGFDKNPGVTRADIITAATKKAKSGSKIKKAQDGDYLDAGELIPKAGPMVKTKVKERSPDGNYVTKTVTRTRKGATTKSSKTRRTLQGYLTGAPRVNELKNGGKMKSGGKMKKCKGGC
jgi:hypothetical protein